MSELDEEYPSEDLCEHGVVSPDSLSYKKIIEQEVRDQKAADEKKISYEAYLAVCEHLAHTRRQLASMTSLVETLCKQLVELSKNVHTPN